MQTGRKVAAASCASLGVVVAVFAVAGTLLVVAGAGFWLLFGPSKHFGCGAERPPGITAADLVGSYFTEDGGQLDLHPDATITASNLNPPTSSRTRLSGAGTWGLIPEDDDLGDIRVSFKSPPGHNGVYLTFLRISGNRADPWLYWYIGDPDSCDLYRFDRA